MPYKLEGDVSWLRQWQLHGRPTISETSLMRRWLDGLSIDPRQYPSAPSPREHPHPQDELRGAFLLDAGGAFVAYAISDAEQVVRVLHIGADPPEGVVFRLPI